MVHFDLFIFWINEELIIVQVNTIQPEIISIDDQIQLKLKPSIRAKKLRISIKGGHAVLTFPYNSSKQKAIEFANQNKAWLFKHLTSQQKINFADQSEITILGKIYKISYSENRPKQTHIAEDKLVVYAKDVNPEMRIKRFLTILLKEEIIHLASDMSKKLGVKFQRISIKEMTSKWGSCSSIGNLSFSLKLIFTTKEVLEYVVAHEICHLKEMNHSPRFWRLVDQLYPNWQQTKSWLKKYGGYLA